MTEPLNKTNAKLPGYVADELRDLRESNDSEFLSTILALRAKGWPLRAIGDVFQVTRAAVQNWVVRAQNDEVIVSAAETVSVPEIPLGMRGTRLKVKKLVPDVPESDREVIRSLTEEASVVKRWTPEGSRAREAALELENLLYHYSVERRVSVTKLAQYAGVTRRAVQQRIEKERNRVDA